MIQADGVQSFWPVTMVGWITAIGFVVTVAVQLVAWGKFLGKLNGFGVRLNKVEDNQTKAAQHRQELQRTSDRILDQHSIMLERLGEAKRTAEKCDEDTVEMGIQIGSRVDTMRREVNDMNLNLSQRLRAVETVLKLKGEN